MPATDHLQRFHAGIRLFRSDPQRFQRIRRSFQQNRVIVCDQDVNTLNPHLLQLLFGDGKIQRNGEGRAFSRFALTFDRPVHQLDHLLGNRKAKSGPLNAVDPAVRLPGKGPIHDFHEFGTHTDAGVRDAIDQPYAAFLLAFLLPQIHGHAAARHRILDGVGKNIDVNLVQSQLICVEIFLLNAIGAKVENNVFLLDHGLRQVHQVLHGFHDGKGDRT